MRLTIPTDEQLFHVQILNIGYLENGENVSSPSMIFSWHAIPPQSDSIEEKLVVKVRGTKLCSLLETYWEKMISSLCRNLRALKVCSMRCTFFKKHVCEVP